MDGVAGLQLCNEAVTDAPGMYSWYDSVIAQIVRIDAALPLYISDAWNLDQAIRYIKEKNKATNPNNPIVIDTHKYYTFAESDRQQSPQEIINRVPNELGELNGRQGNVFDHGAADLVVGEYSCVLDVQTWSKVDGSQRKDLTLQFGRAQSKRWQDKAGGSYFWTYKMVKSPSPQPWRSVSYCDSADYSAGLDGRRRLGFRRANQDVSHSSPGLAPS